MDRNFLLKRFCISFPLIFLFFLTGCVKPLSERAKIPFEDDYFLVLLVDARQLNYTNNQAFFRSMVKHPSDGSKNSDVGHAWLCLGGIVDGNRIEIEGGLSGETGARRLKYFEGIAHLVEQEDPNPVSYMWTKMNDGYFEEGSGGHVPTYAIRVSLSREQFFCLLNFIENYPFENYSLTENQCCTFVQRAAELACIDLPCLISMPIEPSVKIGKAAVLLWEDPIYSKIIFPCPELLEESMKRAVAEDKAEPALDWYLRTHPRTFSERMKLIYDSCRLFPSRIRRVYDFTP